MDLLFLMQEIDFRRKNKIALGQAIDLVGPDRGFHLSPGETQVRMVALLLGQRANPVYKVQSGFEVGKIEAAGEVVVRDHLPPRGFLLQFLQFLSRKGRNSAPAWNAVLLG